MWPVLYGLLKNHYPLVSVHLLVELYYLLLSIVLDKISYDQDFNCTLRYTPVHNMYRLGVYTYLVYRRTFIDEGYRAPLWK